MEPLDAPGLDVRDDPAHQRRAVVVGRVARAVLAGVVGLAALGVFGGGGPLVRAEAAGPDGFTVRYDRFARLDAPLRLDVALPPGDSAVTVTGDLATDLQMEATSPAPRSEQSRPDGVRFVVASGPGPATLTLHARPLRFGVLRGALLLDDGRRLAVRHVIYP
ncbi:hypothetical protein [Rubrivirga sp. IMCC43871]|uniref:hypothetical protein n=1 Tax=Rubrivirga sp. IMCC43871 TaxID=3391575 RepID=UPI0039902166